MNPMERVLATLNHREPDRVPIIHFFSYYGAKELETTVPEYFSKPRHIVEAQLRLARKYSNDALIGTFSETAEIAAFGGEVIFSDYGPPNTGEPVLKKMSHIRNLAVPRIDEARELQKVLTVIKLLKEAVGDTIPILGSVISPFTLPVMQMGFTKYLELLYFNPVELKRLMTINEEFCVTWANAQLKAGATLIVYRDPLASPDIIERSKYLKTGYPMTYQILKKIKGPVAIHLGSAQSLSVIEDLIATGAVAIGVSSEDDLGHLKAKSQKRICLIGNLNGLDMVHWNREKARAKVKSAIQKAGRQGGYIVSDNHGDIPWQVPEEVLLEISEAVKDYGNYPLEMD